MEKYLINDYISKKDFSGKKKKKNYIKLKANS